MNKYLVKVYRTTEQRFDVEVTSTVPLTENQILDFYTCNHLGMDLQGVTISEEKHRPQYDSIVTEDHEIEEA
jgi:hypothetical protein